jgi:hypothetical protein
MNLSPVFTSALIEQHHVSSNLHLDDLALKKEEGGRGGKRKRKKKKCTNTFPVDTHISPIPAFLLEQ